MVKQLEQEGIPAAHICTIVPISRTVGANRIIPAVAIPHPLGNPTIGREDEKQLRRLLLLKALRALQADIKEQTVFDQPVEVKEEFLPNAAK